MKKTLLFLMSLFFCGAAMATETEEATESTEQESSYEYEARMESLRNTLQNVSSYGSKYSSAYTTLDQNYSAEADTTIAKPKKKFKWLVERDGIKGHKFMEDMTWVGVPIFIAGIIAKSEKHAFRQNYNDRHTHTRLVTNFKTGIDDYTQFFGPALTLGLKIGGVEGRSDWTRMLASAGMGYAAMALMVNTIKYTASEMRPDGSTANSWPSGHTATSFVGATILHKEYGLTRSPWYSIAGYGVATATGVMRVLNNRHWVSDILSGAGIGILCGELGYALSDVIFKKKGLLRDDLHREHGLSNHPSFFQISMGMGLGRNELNFGLEDDEDNPLNLKFGTSTVVSAEGAYFFNKYVGLGGRLAVKSSPIKGWNNFLNTAQVGARDYAEYLGELDKEFFPGTNTVANTVTEYELTIESDHMTEFVGSVGLYFNIPLSKRFTLGLKGLVGRSVMQSLDIDGRSKGKVLDVAYDLYKNEMKGEMQYFLNDQHVDYDFNKINDGMTSMNALENLQSFVNICDISVARADDGTEKTYSAEWDFLTVDGKGSTSWGTGISLAYDYKDSYTWKIFCDFDYTEKTFTLNYNPYGHLQYAMPDMIELYRLLQEPLSASYSIRKKMNSWVLGGSFAITF
ncbi:MAG: phosphatase PAP2 family protein [Prevotella sp.]|nr:phosphatase PAP2 family protein [Prevotella sp.]